MQAPAPCGGLPEPAKNGAGGGNRTHTGISPTDFHTSYGFRRRTRPKMGNARLWSGLSLHHALASQGVGAARLVSTPSSTLSQQGLARDRHLTGFPEFEQFCIVGFPASTQFGLSPLRLPIPPRPHCQCVSNREDHRSQVSCGCIRRRSHLPRRAIAFYGRARGETHVRHDDTT